MYGIDLFSGAGGLSLGAKFAGLSVYLAVEKDRDAATTFAKNFPRARVVNADIASLDPPEIKCAPRDLILYGGPPCQGFSTSNRRSRGAENEKNWLFVHFLRFAEAYRPSALIIENVAGAIEGTNRLVFDIMLGRIADIGYHPFVFKLNSAYFGVPQSRNRIFVCAFRRKRSFELSPPRRLKQYTVWDAIHDLPYLENGNSVDTLEYGRPAASGYAEKLRRSMSSCRGHLVTSNAPHVIRRFAHVPPGSNWESIPREYLNNYKNPDACHTGIYRRLEWTKASIVIGNFRKNMLIHPEQNRGLSVREAARLQSFPDRFDFDGTIGKQQQQVGNAVPPKMAAYVFRRVTQAVS